jgi:hypothetical protein
MAGRTVGFRPVLLLLLPATVLLLGSCMAVEVSSSSDITFIAPF